MEPDLDDLIFALEGPHYPKEPWWRRAMCAFGFHGPCRAEHVSILSAWAICDSCGAKLLLYP